MTDIILLLVVAIFLVLGYKKPGTAIVLSPFACVSIMVMAWVEETPEISLLGPGLLLATWVSILASPLDPDADLWPRRVARWLLATMGLLALSMTAAVVFAPLGVAALLLVVVFWGSLIAFGLTARRTTAAVVFSTLSASVRQNLPLPMALESAAAGRADRAGDVMRQISRWLVRGYSLSEAIRHGYARCPAHAYGMIVAAERIGQLPTALEVIERDMHAKAARRGMVSPLYPVYPLILMVVIVLLVSALMRFVVPQYSAVMREVADAPLPWATQWLISIHRQVGEWFGVGFFMAAILVGVILALRWWRPGLPDRPNLPSRMWDFITWHLPLLHWFEQNRSMVQTIAGLRLSFAVGATVDVAIANVLPLDINSCFKARLARWLQAVRQGEDAAVAATHNGVGSSLAWAFDARVNRGNTPAVLEMLESFYRSNYSYRVNLARLVLWPGLTVALASVVAFVAYAIFSPIVAVIYACIDYIP